MSSGDVPAELNQAVARYSKRLADFGPRRATIQRTDTSHQLVITDTDTSECVDVTDLGTDPDVAADRVTALLDGLNRLRSEPSR